MNPQRFAELCAQQALQDFDQQVPLRCRTFFDRGFIDVASGIAQHGLITPDSLSLALHTKRYAPLVFVSPPWKALFQQDDERRHTFAEAVAEYEALVPFYGRWGYEILHLPQASVDERVSFVLSRVAQISLVDV